jgi:hypothetical protein
MKLVEKVARWFAAPVLTKKRIWFAFTVAVVTDGLQLAFAPLGPVGWFFLDDVLDVVAMVLTSLALGFHPLLLPTFIIKLIPVADMLPTWTGCAGVVVMLRKRAQARPPSAPGTVTSEPLTIDVEAVATPGPDNFRKAG